MNVQTPMNREVSTFTPADEVVGEPSRNPEGLCLEDQGILSQDAHRAIEKLWFPKIDQPQRMSEVL